MKEVVFTIYRMCNGRKFEIRTKSLNCVELNCENVIPESLYKCMSKLSDEVGKQGYGCLFELD